MRLNDTRTGSYGRVFFTQHIASARCGASNGDFAPSRANSRRTSLLPAATTSSSHSRASSSTSATPTDRVSSRPPCCSNTRIHARNFNR